MKNYKNKLTFILLFAVLTPCFSLADSDEFPGIYLRTIVYFNDLSTAEKADKRVMSPSHFERVQDFSNVATSPVLNKQLVKDVSINFPMFDVNYLSYFGRGLSDEDRVNVQSYSSAILLDFFFPLSSREDSLLAASEMVLNMAKGTSGFIFDSETRELFSQSEWKASRIDSWSSSVPNVQSNIVIHAYQTETNYRAITLGMAKFGMPDLVVNDFDWNSNRSISTLINLTAQHIVEKDLNKLEFQLDIQKLNSSSFKESLLGALYENATKNASVTLKKSTPEEGDPDNFLLEFDFNQYQGKLRHQKQSTLLNSLFGWKDEVTYVKHNNLIENASEKARKKLPKLKIRFNAGLEIGEVLMLKAPFKTPTGENEWMWVEVKQWKEGEIEGVLRNVPNNVPKLSAGDKLTINQKDVFDYFFQNKDGTTDGNTTGELISKFRAN